MLRYRGPGGHNPLRSRRQQINLSPPFIYFPVTRLTEADDDLELPPASSGELVIDPHLNEARIQELIDQIKESADKLARDRTAIGDLKILSRTLRELRYAFKVFSQYRSRRKVSIFGSARTPETAPAYQTALQLARAMAEQSWLVVTGAASGIMEAGHAGAGRENSMGLNIMLPFEQGSNKIIAGDAKLVTMKYFFTRKLMFVKECDAVVLLPGGFGTLDEGLEVLTLLQTGKRDMVPVVFLDAPGGTFWEPFRHFVHDKLLGERMISPEDLSLFKMTTSIEETVAELLNFYHVYHSMRYVKNTLLIRLTKTLSEETLAIINREFRGILASGEFTQCSAWPEEADEPNLILLPRLACQFNRRSLGRLRELINFLNST
ncbi:MAG: TIGR00730 family Rossman fold protein [Pirellulales bacterium]|nr:TIGR00730 family Rossman fold protein [Pirellulales bacterium]